MRTYSGGKGLSFLALLCTAGLLPLAMPVAALAQSSSSATLVGTVTDSTGARVPAAKVIVVNTGTGFRSETVASPEGNYYVPYLSPGSYQITIDAAGFRSHVRDGLSLRAGETPRVDIVLEVGAMAEVVTVTAAAPLLATETIATAQILEAEHLEAIANVQKRIVRNLYYFPGAVSSEGYSILGQRTRSIGYTLDGISGKTPGTGAFGHLTETIQTTQDAVEEIKVTTSGMSAEVGGAAGGVMNLVFKSGTNEFHGSFEDRYINDKMVHRSYLQQNPTTSPFRFHAVDATISGPVFLPKVYDGQNRTFFLFGFATHIEDYNPQARTTVPSLEMLNGDFGFEGQGLPIYDPFTTRQNDQGTWVRDPFPNNIIPKERFDPAVVNFLARQPWAVPNEPGIMTRTGPTQNLVAEQKKRIRRSRWDVKIDQQFSAKHKIFGRYSHAHHRADRAEYRAQLNWREIDSNAQPVPTDNINIVLNDTYVFGPQQFNEMRLGYNRRAYSLRSLTWDQDWAGKLGIPNVSPLTFPYFNIGFGLASLGREYQVGEDLTFQNNYTHIRGQHTLKVGYQIIRTRYNAAMQAQPSGTYTFTGTNHPFTPNTGITFASFLLGTVNTAVYTEQMATWLPRWWKHAGFIQDDWKPVPGLTLNLGLRWSYESPFNTKYGQQSQFDPNAIDPLSGLKGAITHPSDFLHKRDLNNFQPRLGLAWNFRPKWVFRSSFGVLTQDLGVTDVGQNFQEYNGIVNVQAPPGDPRHVFRLSDGPPPIVYPMLPDGSILFVGDNYSGRHSDWIDPNLRMPYVLNWSAGFQYEFARNWLAELTYQGTSGIGLLNYWNINVIPLDVSSDRVELDRIYQAQQEYKPYTQFGNVQHYSNYGHSTHHSGTLRVEKRYASGVTLMSYYTFAKTLNERDGDGSANGITFYNRSLEKGRAGYDIQHRFNSMLTYEVPLGPGRRWLNRTAVVSSVLGGWDFTWTQTFQSGPPATISFSSSPNRYLPGNSRPNPLGTLDEIMVKNWEMGPHRFPTSAQQPYLMFDKLTYPAAYTPGALGRNVFENPGMQWMQVGLTKSWSYRERMRFTLRVNMHNLPIKNPQFSGTNSTYNANSPGTFGRFTGTRGAWSEFGTSQSNTQFGIRVQW